jgi:hypothetical protein
LQLLNTLQARLQLALGNIEQCMSHLELIAADPNPSVVPADVCRFKALILSIGINAYNVLC